MTSGNSDTEIALQLEDGLFLQRVYALVSIELIRLDLLLSR